MTENLLNNIIASAEEQFGKGCIDVSDDIYFVIKVPDTTITNEKGTKYLNRGIYVKVNKGTALFIVGKAYYTSQEMGLGFIHPHVNPFQDRNLFSTPCLGQGPLRSLIAEIDAERDEEALISLWDLYMMQLKVFLETESIAGIPYVRLDKVMSYSNEVYSSNFIPGKLKIYSYAGLALLQNVVRRAIIEDMIPIIANEVGRKYEGTWYTEAGAVKPYFNSKYINSRYMIILSDILYQEVPKICAKYEYDKELLLKELKDGYILEEYVVDKHRILTIPLIYSRAYYDTLRQRAEGKFLTSFKGEDIMVQVEDFDINNRFYTISYTCLYYIVSRINVELHNTVKRDGETLFIS